MKQGEQIRCRATIWEIPLALLSFLFYRGIRFCFQRIFHLSSLLDRAQSCRWRVFCAQEARSLLNMLAVMTSGPRLNTHAILATVGPLQVERAIRLHVAAAARSARSWTIVVYAMPGYQTVATIGSLSMPDQEPWQSVALQPGCYRLVLRYYQWSEPFELPMIEVDGVQVVPARVVPENINDFYHDLRNRNSFLYLCMHYYVGTLLRYRRWLPRSFVEREYLPVGNPETNFYYGFLNAGEALSFDLDARLLQTHDIYFTYYNRASLPVVWYPLQEIHHTTVPSRNDGTYLLRIHRKVPSPEPFDRDWIHIHVRSPGTASDERRITGSGTQP